VNAVDFAHDPHIAKDRGWYYVFSTGPGVPIRRSKDLKQWEHAGRVFQEDVPAWAREEIPGSRGIWASDATKVGDLWYLYYSVSTFGSDRSVIGLAVNKTLDPASKDYRWEDRAKVVESFRGGGFNAIDANPFVYEKGRLTLAWGSHWSGLKMQEMDPKTGKPKPGSEMLSIAARPRPGAIEAPCLLKRNGWYYLLASFDACCRGVNSTYNIRVGRAKKVTGPYVDRDGKPMLEGGGTLLLGTEGRYIGPGHCSVWPEKDRVLLAYHFYDRDRNGLPTLQVRRLDFDKDGWPVAGPILSGDPPKP
jgi:arabinan endo-1,5-alpha-L-arabinosidase